MSQAKKNKKIKTNNNGAGGAVLWLKMEKTKRDGKS